MKISELRDAYYEASAKVSDLVRQLALAGIAVVWIFRLGGEHPTGVHLQKPLLLPLGSLILTLVTDLLQYVYKTIVWGLFNWSSWRAHPDNDWDVDVSGFWNWVTIGFFWLKVVLLAVAYFLLLQFVYKQL